MNRTEKTSQPELAAQLGSALAEYLLSSLSTAPSNAIDVQLPHPFSNLSWHDWQESITLWLKHGQPLLKDVAARACPVCAATKSDALFVSYDGYPYHECHDCRVWYIPLEINHELFERYFTLVPQARRYGDYTDSQSNDASVEAVDRERFDEYYADIKTCLNRGNTTTPTTLDIGCGVANSLAVAADHGFAAFGLEVNENAVQIAHSLGRNVAFPGEGLARSEFDAITLWESLEHIAQPLPVLELAYKHLAKDGVLALTVPNLDSPCIRSMRGDSLQIHGGPAWPGHMNLFTKSTLEQLLNRAGFQVLHVAGQYSMNLEELWGYHLGRWSGARDYLKSAGSGFRLPAAAKELTSALGGAIRTWEEAHAFAPILRVLACRSDGDSPSGLAALKKHSRNNSSTTLSVAYGIGTQKKLTQNFGSSIPADASTWVAPEVMQSADRLRLSTTATTAPSGYLWRSNAITLAANNRVRVTGLLFEGGLSIGLLKDDAFATSGVCHEQGAFVLELAPEEAGTYDLVVSNHAGETTSTKAEILAIDLVAN